jgi:hypothetical protein
MARERTDQEILADLLKGSPSLEERMVSEGFLGMVEGRLNVVEQPLDAPNEEVSEMLVPEADK